MRGPPAAGRVPGPRARSSAFLALSCLASLPPTLPRTRAEGPADPTSDIEKLKEEVRQLKEQVKELRDRSKGLANQLTYAPDVEVQDEDYAAARSRMRLVLTAPCSERAFPKRGRGSRH